MLATFPLDRAQEVVDGIPEDRRVVLLGESTHGTEEFYRTREAITKRLVEERGFTAVMFEADWPAMQAANEYVHRLRATPYEEDIRFPKWMWHNQCMSDFFEWAKRLEPEQTPQLFGIDCCESEWRVEWPHLQRHRGSSHTPRVCLLWRACRLAIRIEESCD